jgi:hypothetical protein
MNDIDAIARWFAENGMRARVEHFEGHEHVVVEEAPFASRPTEFRVTVYERTDDPSAYRHTWHVDGVGTLGLVARGADPSPEIEARVKRLVHHLYGESLTEDRGVLFFVRRLPPQTAKLCARLGVEVPVRFDLAAIASAVRAAAFSRPVPSPDFRELAATAIETESGQMEHWCAWANDPEAMVASELDRLRKMA